MMMPHIAKNILESICKMLIGMKATAASPYVPRKYDTAPFSICKMENRPYASPFWNLIPGLWPWISLQVQVAKAGQVRRSSEGCPVQTRRIRA